MLCGLWRARHTHKRKTVPSMRRRVTYFLIGVLCGLVFAAQCVLAEDIKSIHPTGPVTDLAHILQPQTKAQLEAMCIELEQKTGAQMAIVSVNSLDGNDIETYSADLFKSLGVGSKKENGGVLFLVAPNERKYRTEVGYGLEPVINDARAGDAGRLAVPFFRKGDYSGGTAAAAWQLAKYIADDKGVTLTGMPQQVRRVRQKDDSGIGVWVLLGIILLIFLLARSGGSGSNINRRGGGGNWWIGPMIGGGGGWGGGGGGGGGGWGGFGGGMSGGGGASGSW